MLNEVTTNHESAESLSNASPSEPEEKIIKRYKLESTVSLVSDREAKELTPTAEKCKEALARFLASRETQAPLTVSIEAPWGAGKTSFMHHLRQRLEAEKIPTVWFNPWKHEAGKTMWAAFAVAYERQLGSQLWFLRRWACRVVLNLCRMKWLELVALVLRLGAAVAVGMLLWLGVPAFLSWWSATGEDKDLRELLLRLVGLVGPTYVILKDLLNIGSNPLKVEMLKGLARDPHAPGVDDLHRFHEDFARVMRAYHPANGWWARLFDRKRLRRVAVFIDDLDRCEAPKAADVLQSLHLMLNVTESCLSESGKDKRMPDMICILGMDREKVAAAVAAKHEKLLPLLLEADKDTGKVPKERAMGFGHEFLEKFIQLTLHLPGMMGKDQEHFLKGITGWNPNQLIKLAPATLQGRLVSKPSLTKSAPNSQTGHLTQEESLPPEPSAVEVAAQAEQVKQAVQARVREVDEQLHDGQTAYDCAQYVADALENNPRRLKQFVNLLRLRLLLAAALDLLDADTLSAEVTVVKEGKLSAHHLAKLVALDLMCPQSMAVMRGNPGVTFEELESEVMKEQKERQDVFTTLIKHGHGGRPVNSCWLGTAPLAAYFQQLAAVAPASIVAETM